MLASSFGDPVIGVDVHFELVPTPAPTPTPLPNPFTGVVFDPVGLAAGLVLGAAVSAVLGAPILGPVVYWGAIPATNTGTEAKHIPGHIIIPPGTGWAPFPKTPKPVIHPGETPEPPNPVKPEDDAIIVFGSKTVTVMGSNAVRLGDIALSCSEPLRLPSSVVLAVPKGAPILIGGPPSLDILAAVLASLRTRFVSDSLHALISRLRPSRMRNLLHRGVCFLTGHPVDVASGRVLTDSWDATLWGPSPLRVERAYSSAFANRASPIGYGWSLSLDQWVDVERGCAVLHAEDGREIVFDTFDFPRHELPVGRDVTQPIDGLTLRRLANGCFTVTHDRGTVRTFAPLPSAPRGKAMLRSIVAPGGYDRYEFEYDESGRLASVRGSTGRSLILRYDSRGRLVALLQDAPSGDGFDVQRRYAYDDRGDLVSVTDSMGRRWQYQYEGHLLVRETDRNDLSFYFLYDGLGADAHCVRTWGDDGVFDHVIAYDKGKKVTFVTDSCGNTTQYHCNVAGLVVKVVDPLGGERQYEYDPVTLTRLVEVEPELGATRYERDAAGRLLAIEKPDGARAQMRYDAAGHIAEMIDPLGGRWCFEHEASGHRRTMIDPLGHCYRYQWAQGRLQAAIAPDGAREAFTYDTNGNRTEIHRQGRVQTRLEYDRRGRTIAVHDATGTVRRFLWDGEDRLRHVVEGSGNRREYAYDGEGAPVEYRDLDHHVVFARDALGRLLAREEGGTKLQFAYDTEGRRTKIVNEAGFEHRFEYDECGRLAAQTTYDGRVTQYMRRSDGRVVTVMHPDGGTTALSYDAAGRTTRAEHSEGAFEEFAYGPDGSMLEANCPDAKVRFERDALGRIRREWQGEDWCDYRYAYDGHLQAVQTSWGHSHSFVLDAERQPVEVTVGEVPVARLAFDGEGRETGRRFAGDAAVTFGRDQRGRVATRQVDTHAGRRERRYARSASGYITAIADDDGTETRPQFDARRRVVGHAAADDTNATVRALDPVGNVYRESNGSDRRYTDGGQLLQTPDEAYEYDDVGRLVARRLADGEQWRYHWDAFGRLRQVERPDGTEVRLRYDALGRRTSKEILDGDAVVASDRWLWQQWTPIQVAHSDGDSEAWVFEQQSHTPLLAVRNGSLIGFAPSPNGSVSHGYDAEQNEVFRLELDAFGEPTVLEDSTRLRPRFVGQYADDSIGLYYNRFRWYDPKQGRYISPDPLGIDAGPSLYAYVPDPFTQGDPFGLHTVIGSLDGTPVTQPNGDPRFRNTGGSRAPMAPHGFGRAGHSETLLVEQALPQITSSSSELVIESIDSTNPRTGGLWTSLDPCFRNGDGCFAGLQRLATDQNITVRYRVTTFGRDLPPDVGLRQVLAEFVFDPDPSRSTVRYPDDRPCR